MKLIVLLLLLPISYGESPCLTGRYQSTFTRLCLKCTQCKPDEILISPCQAHRDTICASSAGKLLLDDNSLDHHQEKWNKRNHHFVESKLHHFDDILDNTLNYPALELAIKHDDVHSDKHKDDEDKKKQRKNCKFLKWANDDDGDDKHEKKDEDNNVRRGDWEDLYEMKKHGTKQHQLSKPNHHHKDHHHHHHHQQHQHHNNNNLDSSEEQEDSDKDENLDRILDKHAKSFWNKKKWNSYKLHKIAKHKENAARLAQLEDEKKLEEWLVQSKKQFKDRKDNLLKTLKEEQQQMDSYENDNRIKLNYPLSSANNKFEETIKYNTKIDEKSKVPKKHKESEMDLFKELIKDEESQEMELATLMSNKKDQSLHYKTVVTPAHRMYLGAPSDGRHIKDPQEVIKEEMGRKIIYEKAKFSVVPIVKDGAPEEIGSLPFTAAERLVWDWQAVAIVSAIAACLLFFLVIGIFVLFNARHWKKEKFQYNHPESEEMSTRIALIQTS
ncbi:uncharacterized protein [Rhodnius prolixus]|uniref:TNFR-Cys domain-containing protein n=1 Tax=Rhodnius prolixus TaxID=13249 RepID=T1HKF7_RHOPR